MERWRENVPDDFRFCPKIPQSISHARDLGMNGVEIKLFCDAIIELKEKLGYCFMQLPEGFGPRGLGILKRFLEYFPKSIPLALEVRNPLFFTIGEASADYFNLLEEHQIAAVITDVAGRRDVCHMRLTCPVTMIRFVGNGLHKSDYTRVEDWAKRLKSWFESGLQSAYFFTHEPDNLLAPELAAICEEKFREAVPGLVTRGPNEAAGRQGTLFFFFLSDFF